MVTVLRQTESPFLKSLRKEVGDLEIKSLTKDTYLQSKGETGRLSWDWPVGHYLKGTDSVVLSHFPEAARELVDKRIKAAKRDPEVIEQIAKDLNLFFKPAKAKAKSELYGLDF